MTHRRVTRTRGALSRNRRAKEAAERQAVAGELKAESIRERERARKLYRRLRGEPDVEIEDESIV